MGVMGQPRLDLLVSQLDHDKPLYSKHTFEMVCVRAYLRQKWRRKWEEHLQQGAKQHYLGSFRQLIEHYY